MAEVLFNNRKFVLALLGVPVLGMLIAAGLIIYKQPSNMYVALGVILFVAMQYIITMFFWMKRVEKMAKKENSGQESIFEKLSVELIDFDTDQVLIPEEKRVFQVDENNT